MYEKFDAYIGIVIGTSSKGCYVEAEGNDKTHGFYYGGGRVGDKVLCTVKRTDRTDSLLLSLDAVLKYAEIVPAYHNVA